MRPHGRYFVDPTNPRALGVCDRCGFIYNHDRLQWQFQWVGTKLQNQRFLVCPQCLDVPQEQLRTILIPPDPVPIQNARPENYIAANNPLSAIGANPDPRLDLYSAQIGTMIYGAGLPAAFDGNTNKPSLMSAAIIVPDSSFGNYIGINWAEYPAGTLPVGLDAPPITHRLDTFTIYAPNDMTFGSSTYLVQGSNFGVVTFGSWTTVASGSIQGFIGEQINGRATGDYFQFHRVAFWGGGGFPIVAAQVQFNVSDIAIMTTS